MQSNSMKSIPTRNFNVLKSTLEWIGLSFLLILSFINHLTLLIFMLIILLLLVQKEIGALKIVNLLTLRSIINPGVSIGIDDYQNLKWIILFGCSLYLLTFYFKLEKEQKNKIRGILLLVSVFTLFNIFTAFVYSSLPVISTFKLLSYVIIFLGIVIGIGYTSKKFDWIKWMFIMFQLLMVVSIFLINTPVGYLRNGRGFQGFVNHPNLFAVIAVLYFAITLAYIQTRSNYRKYNVILLAVITIYMIILSESRTAFISMLVLLLTYFIFFKTNKVIKIVRTCSIGILIILLFFTQNYLSRKIIGFLYKGQDNFLYSRENQIDTIMQNFSSNPLFGTGFAVPVLPYRSFEFSTEYVVEPGNLILAVLSYSGIFGLIIFIAYIAKIFFVNIVNFNKVGYLFISPILISMGEMTFFSSNNIGIWCYMLLAIYIFFVPENKLS